MMRSSWLHGDGYCYSLTDSPSVRNGNNRVYLCMEWIERYFEIPYEARQVRIWILDEPSEDSYEVRVLETGRDIIMPDGQEWYVVITMQSILAKLGPTFHLELEYR